METHSCTNVALFKHDSGRRDREERTGQDRTVLGDTSRVGDVTGKKKVIVFSFGVLFPKKYGDKEDEEADRLYVGDFPQFTGNKASATFPLQCH